MDEWAVDEMLKDLDDDAMNDGRFLDLGFWLSDEWKNESIAYCDDGIDIPYFINGSYLSNEYGPYDVIDIIISYYRKIRAFEIMCERSLGVEWDDRQKLCSTAKTVYLHLMKRLTDHDYDYIEDVADDISYFHTELVDEYRLAKEKGEKAEACKEVFLIGIRLLRDIMDYIYRCIGLPID